MASFTGPGNAQMPIHRPQVQPWVQKSKDKNTNSPAESRNLSYGLKLGWGDLQENISGVQGIYSNCSPGVMSVVGRISSRVCVLDAMIDFSFSS